MRQVGNASRRTGGVAKGGLLGLFFLVSFMILLTAPVRGAGTHQHLPTLSHSGYGSGCGAAVDSDGDLYASDFGTVHIYDTAGAEITSHFAPNACMLAIDSTGALYVQTWSGSGGQVRKYLPSEYPPVTGTTYSLDTSVLSGTGLIDSGPSRGIAVDPASGDLYVSHPQEGATPSRIFQYHSDGALVTNSIGSGLSGAGYSGLDVYGANGRVYAFDGLQGQVAIFNPGASTPTTTFDGSGTPGGSISAALPGEGLAVDQSNGHVFLYDSAHNVVPEFTAKGDYVTQLSNAFEDGEPSDIAVDNSGGPNDGDIYVVTLHAVDAFGVLEHQHLPTLSHSGYGSGCGAAVDSDGDLYASDFGTVHIYDTAGAEITSHFAPNACMLAIDSTGALYVQTWSGSGGQVRKYLPSEYPPVTGTTYSLDTSVLSGTGLIDSGPSRGIAVDPASGDLYVSHPQEGATPSRIFQYHSDGALVTNSIGSGLSGAGYSGLDVYGANGRVYAFDGLQGQVAIFNPGASTPTTTFDGSGTPGGSISAALPGEGLAVDQSNGHVFLYDSAHNVVPEFTAKGDYVTQLSNAFEDGEPSDIAVDNSGGPNDGDIYVVTLHAVDAFGPMTGGVEQFLLTVFKEGIGSGAVSGGSTDEPDAIDCGATCEAEFDPDTEVVLAATPDLGSTFDPDTGWTGCITVDIDGKCHVTMDDIKAVKATFSQPALTVVKEGAGSATITSTPAGIDCGPTCVANFPVGETVFLTPSVSPGSKFKSWSGCDAVEGLEEEICKVTMTEEDKTVTATITHEPMISSTKVTNVGSSSATVQSTLNPNGEPTTWRFEYVDDAEFQNNGFTNAKKTPVPDFSAGATATDVSVSRSLTGLDPETEYHFRLVATNYVSPPGGTNGEEATFTTYATSVTPPSCGNDSFRTGPSAKLPDCRAYEQVSPIDKNGQDVMGRYGSMAASVDGDRVVYYALNGQPGGQGPQSFPVYLASRDADGWSASGLLPPVSYGGSAAIRGWFPDFSTVFSRATDLNGSGVTTFLSRRSSDGALSVIATEGAGDFVGAGADSSIVYFQGRGNDGVLTPDAVSGKPNLYAWERDTNALVLAGVLPDAACGSPPCVPTKGTTVQGQYPVEDHAISADGSAYFSDVGTGQLYLREDPFGAASTVNVSASQRTEPQTPLPATFQRATPDGAHAFFTSPEELTDASNTGPNVDPPAIGLANSADGSIVDPSHIPLFGHAPSAMAADADHLYWLEPATNSIARADLDGENVDHEFIKLSEIEVEPDEFVAANPKGIAVGGGRIYWTSAADDLEHPFDSSPATIGRAELNGNGAATNIEPECITDVRKPRGIDVNVTQGFVYWAGISKTANNLVGRADISGTCADADTSANPSFVSTGVSEISDIAVNDSHIYASGSNGFRRFDINDGTPSGFHAFQGSQEDAPLALDGSHLYWGLSTSGAIGRSDLDLNNANESFVTSLTAPVGLALGQGADLGHLYWATGVVGGGRGEDLYRYDAESGDLTDLTPDDTTELGADVRGVLGTSDDGDYVYFVANADLDGADEASAGNCTDVQIRANGSLGGTGQCSIYLVHDGQTTFIARLEISNARPPFTDADNWVVGAGPAFFGKAARVSADGKTLLFRSKRKLTAYNNQGAICASDINDKVVLPGPCAEIYRYNIDDGLRCVSCNPTGAPPSWPARLTQFAPGNGVPNITTSARLRNLSADGKRIFFESADKLVAADTNGDSGCPQVRVAASGGRTPACLDVYEWEADGSGSCHSFAQNGGCLYLISAGTGSEPSLFLDASVSGDDAFFFTRDRLVPQDTDGIRDVYDASVDGGLDAQHAVAPAQCDGDTCREGAGSPSDSPTAGTAAFQGAGNQPPSHGKKPPRCPKGKRKVRSGGKVRCVKRHHTRHKRAANNDRRASR